MPVIRNKLIVEMHPTVQEVCEVISAVAAFYPRNEVMVLQAIKDATSKRIEELEQSKSLNGG